MAAEQSNSFHDRLVRSEIRSNNVGFRKLDTDATLTDQERTQAALEFLKTGFARFDEVWVVGHKGDHAVNLQNLGVVKEHLDLVHVHSTLGVSADNVIKPPPESAGSYEGILTELSTEILPHIARVRDQGRKVIIYMPFPNMGLEHAIARADARAHFTMTAPVANYDAFQKIEHKIIFGQMMDELFRGTGFERNLIPWTFYSTHMDFQTLRETLGTEGAVYMQRVLSAGGDGTVKVSSESELHALMQDSLWRMAAEMGSVKASKGIENTYPANGTGCIVPTSDGECIVLVDPLSHKPVGLESMNAKQGSGVGNDWSTPFTADIQSQYVAMATKIGKRLFQEHGYTGLFGPDGMIGSDNVGKVYSLTEVNSRWQGTTPYQTLNATMNGRLPLELIHYMVKLCETPNGFNEYMLRELWSIIGDPNEYNERALKERGGFYIKIGGPKNRSEVKVDLNGAWIANSASMQRVENIEGLTPMHVYTRTLPDGRKLELPEGQALVWVKAPKAGETVGGELAPIGYIIGSGIQVFDAETPQTTEFGQSMYDTVSRKMFE